MKTKRKKITDPRAAALAKLAPYLRALANEYGLRDWEIRLAVEPASPGSMAEVGIAQNQKLATISLNAEFTTYSPDEQRSTLLHELTHLHVYELESVVSSAKKALGPAAWRVFRRVTHKAVEQATDAISRAISSRFPLP